MAATVPKATYTQAVPSATPDDIAQGLGALAERIEREGPWFLIVDNRLVLDFDFGGRSVPEDSFFEALAKKHIQASAPALRCMLSAYAKVVLEQMSAHSWYDPDRGVPAFAHAMEALIELDRTCATLLGDYLHCVDIEHATDYHPDMNGSVTTAADAQLAITLVLYDIDRGFDAPWFDFANEAVDAISGAVVGHALGEVLDEREIRSARQEGRTPRLPSVVDETLIEGLYDLCPADRRFGRDLRAALAQRTS